MPLMPREWPSRTVWQSRDGDSKSSRHRERQSLTHSAGGSLEADHRYWLTISCGRGGNTRIIDLHGTFDHHFNISARGQPDLISTREQGFQHTGGCAHSGADPRATQSADCCADPGAAGSTSGDHGSILPLCSGGLQSAFLVLYRLRVIVVRAVKDPGISTR